MAVNPCGKPTAASATTSPFNELGGAADLTAFTRFAPRSGPVLPDSHIPILGVCDDIGMSGRTSLPPPSTSLVLDP